MRCRQVRGLLREFAGGALPAEEHAALQRHLAGCPACAREARSLEATRRLLGALVEGEGPSSAFCQRPWRRLAEIREGRAEAGFDALWASARRLVPAAAALVVLLGGLTYLIRPLEPRGLAPMDRLLGASGIFSEGEAPLGDTATLTRDDVLALVLLQDGGVVAR